jgi:hypothetical protein
MVRYFIEYWRFSVVSSKRLETVQGGHHIIAIYPTIGDEINEAVEFLKQGLERNEAVMILPEDVEKDKLLKE